jgi:hypothetical protein
MPGKKERRGNNPGTYFVAVAGGLKSLLLRKNREEPNGSTWTLFVTERQPREGTFADRHPRDEIPPAANAARAAAMRDYERQQRDARVAELAGRFDEREPTPAGGAAPK